MTDQPETSRPMLRIEGGATAQETAAIIAVLTSIQAPRSAPRARRLWGSPAWSLGQTPLVAPGPGAWRAASRSDQS